MVVALDVWQPVVTFAGWAVVRMLKLKGNFTVLNPSAISFWTFTAKSPATLVPPYTPFVHQDSTPLPI